MSFYDWVSDNIVDVPAERKCVNVGWLFRHEENSIIYEDPERIRSVATNAQHAKSASRCPAILNLESRYFLIRCPFNIHLGFTRDNKGIARLQNKMDDRSPVRTNQLEKVIKLVSERE